MKTKNLLKLSAVSFGLLLASGVMALDHGSMVGVGEPLYPLRNGAAPGAAVEATMDFKLVTIGEKTWVYTNLNGMVIAETAWGSQLRYWPGGTENWLSGRVNGTQETYGTVENLPSVPQTITFMQEQANAFFETMDYSYDKTIKNSLDPTDTEKPVLIEATNVNFTGVALTLKLAATDNSGQYFYHIIDEEKGIEEISFFDNFVITGLLPDTEYNLTVTAIDFSGNESDPKTVQLGETELVSITSGIAKDIYFELSSTSNSVTVFCKPVADGAVFSDAYIKIAHIEGDLSNGAEIKTLTNEWAGVPSYTYTISNLDFFGEGEIIQLDLGYLFGPITNPPSEQWEWDALFGAYVIDNTFITEGEFAGSPIFHIMAGDPTSAPKVKETASSIEKRGEEIIISTNNGVASAGLYTLNGLLVSSLSGVNVIGTSSLNKGIYILKVTDTEGNQDVFKVVID
ncbi:MAG: T9SS type A sorting domain-containing protein [Candidatus Azobacteroides sp.]|nr:T9SS type A sorting domain-containing protein [Candidatus Azobacteroides sp.]